MTENEKSMANLVRVLLLELEAAYHGLRTLPRNHSAVEAASKAEALLEDITLTERLNEIDEMSK